MARLSYFGVLLVCVVASTSLEFFLRTRVLVRIRRFILAVIPTLVVFMVWDAYAIAQHHWTFNLKYMTGVTTVARIPIEEVAFFIVIPLCAVLTLEAIRSARGWRVGDEEPVDQAGPP